MVGNQVVISTSDILSRIAEGGIVQVIASGRKTSRTTRLIEMAAEFEAKHEVCYIVCKNHEQAYRIAQKARELNLNIGFPLTYDEFLSEDYHGNNIKKFLIDNADHLLQYMTSVEIAAIVVETTTGD